MHCIPQTGAEAGGIKMANTNIQGRTAQLVRLAVLAAVILIMAYTPLGYLKTAGLEISFLTIPVVIGAIVIGPAGGAILGGIFGLTSFLQCFGASVFGATLLAINPFYTFLVTVVARVLMGWITGLIFLALGRVDKTKILSFGAASLVGPLLNTFFFMGFLVLLFYQTDYIQGFVAALGAKSVLSFVALFVGLQGLVEARVCFVAGTAISKALFAVVKKKFA
jgi:uncharacterized membrane protein